MGAAIGWRFEKALSDSCGTGQCQEGEKRLEVFICQKMKQVAVL